MACSDDGDTVHSWRHVATAAAAAAFADTEA